MIRNQIIYPFLLFDDRFIRTISSLNYNPLSDLSKRAAGNYCLALIYTTMNLLKKEISSFLWQKVILFQ